MIFYILFSTFIIICSFYFIQSCKKNKFYALNINHLIAYPFFGNTIHLLTQIHHITDILNGTYNAYNQRFVGFYYFGTAVTVLKDLNLIKRICVNDFESFHDHLGYVDEKIDPIFGNNLFSLRGKKWHDMRLTLNKVFTRSKISDIHTLVDICTNRMVTFLGKNCYKEIEVKNLFNLFANDVIASVAFGKDVDSFSDPNNAFLRMSQKLISQTRLKSEHSKMQIFKIAMSSNFPSLMKHFRGPVLSKDVAEYFKTVVLENASKRKEDIKKGYGVIQTMADNGDSTGNQIVWDANEQTAQAVIFLISGLETVATFLSFLTYELATHPNVQKRLQDEIDGIPQVNIDEAYSRDDFSILHEFKYLKMVISEALRLWPPVMITDRKCTKICDLGSPGYIEGESYTMDINESIWIPIYSIQRDGKYFENPETFDPERFSEENIKNVPPYAYLPFGLGPRSCIAQKFVFLETKVALVKILKNFNIETTPNTQIPVKLNSKSLNMQTENGIPLKFTSRK